MPQKCLIIIYGERPYKFYAGCFLLIFNIITMQAMDKITGAGKAAPAPKGAMAHKKINAQNNAAIRQFPVLNNPNPISNWPIVIETTTIIRCLLTDSLMDLIYHSYTATAERSKYASGQPISITILITAVSIKKLPIA